MVHPNIILAMTKFPVAWHSVSAKPSAVPLSSVGLHEFRAVLQGGPSQCGGDSGPRPNHTQPHRLIFEEFGSPLVGLRNANFVRTSLKGHNTVTWLVTAATTRGSTGDLGGVMTTEDIRWIYDTFTRVNTLRPRRDGRHFQTHFLYENCCILFQISVNLFLRVSLNISMGSDNGTNDGPVYWHICVTWPQCVKSYVTIYIYVIRTCIYVMT